MLFHPEWSSVPFTGQTPLYAANFMVVFALVRYFFRLHRSSPSLKPLNLTTTPPTFSPSHPLTHPKHSPNPTILASLPTPFKPPFSHFRNALFTPSGTRLAYFPPKTTWLTGTNGRSSSVAERRPYSCANSRAARKVGKRVDFERGGEGAILWSIIG